MKREPLWDEILKIKPNFQDEMEYVEQELFKCVPESTPSTLHDAARHLIMTGGKRIRPALTILAYDAVKSRDFQLTFSGRFDATYERIDTLVLTPPVSLSLDEVRGRARAAFQRRLQAIAAVPADHWDEELDAVARVDGAEHYREHRSYIVVT